MHGDATSCRNAAPLALSLSRCDVGKAGRTYVEEADSGEEAVGRGLADLAAGCKRHPASS
jgi:hypothetical protein